MNTKDINKLSGDLYNLMLHLHSKFFNPSEMTKNLPMPHSHMKVIIYLARHGTCSISETAKNLTISKPNMTPIIDKLIAEGMINRYNDPNDRRVLRIELTDKAYEFIKVQEGIIKDNLAKKISSLSPDDLEALRGHVLGITDMILKVD